jgi:LmbE family N-acetylglucosaminyl deacetylase
VVDVSDTMEQKLESIRCYESQFRGAVRQVKHFVSGYNITQGARCGFAYGELFALPHPIGTGDLHALVLGGRGSPAPVQLPGQSHLPMN